MRRLGPKTLYSVAFLSLVLLLVVVAFGVRSFWTADGVAYQTYGGKLYILASTRQGVYFRCETCNVIYAGIGHPGWQVAHAPSSSAWVPMIAFSPQVFSFHFLGIEFERRSTSSVPTPGHMNGTFWWPYFQFIVPHSAIALPAVLAFILALRAILASRRNRAGHCRQCGYDLRATPDGCPECGAVPPIEKATPK